MFRCTMTINYGEDKTPLMKVNFMTVDVQLSHQVVTKLQNGGHCCRLKHLRVTPGVVLIHLGIICGKNLYHHNKVRPLSLNVISILKGNRFVVSKCLRSDAQDKYTYVFCMPNPF